MGEQDSAGVEMDGCLIVFFLGVGVSSVYTHTEDWGWSII